MQDNGEYVRSAYHVPARRHMTILFQGHEAKITGFDGQYLVVTMGGIKHLRIHPTWEVVYPAPTP